MEKTKTVRCGIVGSGFAASFHYEAIRKVHGAIPQIAGVYSDDAKQLSDFTAARGLDACSSLDELLERSEIIHVCVPPSAHESVAVAALQRGLHAIVEKPPHRLLRERGRGF